MAITLSNGTTTITLPSDLEWINEYLWSKQKDQVDITLAGGLLIQNSQQISGRPITISGGEDFGWMEKADMDTLMILVNAGLDMTLTLNDGRSFQVRFRYDETPVKSTPIEPNLTKYNNITIALREV